VNRQRNAGAPQGLRFGLFHVYIRTAGAAAGVTIRANRAVAEFDGAKAATDIADSGFVHSLRGSFTGLL